MINGVAPNPNASLFSLVALKLSPWYLVKHNAFSSNTEGISQNNLKVYNHYDALDSAEKI